MQTINVVCSNKMHNTNKMHNNNGIVNASARKYLLKVAIRKRAFELLPAEWDDIDMANAYGHIKAELSAITGVHRATIERDIKIERSSEQKIPLTRLKVYADYFKTTTDNLIAS